MLKPDAKIFGGFIEQEPGKLWPPRKEYGKVKIIYEKIISKRVV